jgi:hypothetical protein
VILSVLFFSFYLLLYIKVIVAPNASDDEVNNSEVEPTSKQSLSKVEKIYHQFLNVQRNEQSQSPDRLIHINQNAICETLPQGWKDAYEDVVRADDNAREMTTVALVKWVQFGAKLHREEMQLRQNNNETEYGAERKVSTFVMSQGVTKEFIFQARKIWRCLHNIPLDIVARVRGVSPRTLRNLTIEQADAFNVMLQGYISKNVT